MGGAAPAVDSHGNLWVSTGNSTITASGHRYDNSDGTLQLSPSLRLLQYFAPASWPADNASDIDFSASPALLADGQVVQAGKSGRVFLLDGRRLGGVGGQQAVLRSACDVDIDGGTAVSGTTVYLPVPVGHHRGPGEQFTAAAASALAVRCRRRPADPGGRPGLDDRAERHAVRPRPNDGQGQAAGQRRSASQPLPDPRDR